MNGISCLKMACKASFRNVGICLVWKWCATDHSERLAELVGILYYDDSGSLINFEYALDTAISSCRILMFR